ncbi:tetratricopeptide repeat protein 25 [Trichonephila inaurata madagascariensis]|uniref:Outer dynein arm-docking complex subunit 4 n=1 Tax=Trichonephila inaurata madagascariensis TaxID=2747483 RepID=A0A8X6YVS2_9ARAC|nr:tetratricopeptide repeat protein 25 [Trichonephila inaurata madagascariensis]
MLVPNESEMDLDAFLESLMKPVYVPKFPFSLYFSEGCKYYHKGMYEKAIEKLDEALNLEPTNIRALLARAKVHIYLRQFDKAKEDANEALKLWPEYSEAYDLKGLSQYLKGDFEGAYITYFTGRKLRPCIEKLRLGQQLCEQAIDNSMKEKGGLITKEDVNLVRRVREDGSRFERKSRSKMFTFERFSKDKKILEELLSDEDVICAHRLCQDSLNVIQNTERFWAMENPLSTRKNWPTIRQRFVKRGTVIQYIVSMKNRCQYYLQGGLADQCITESQNLLKQIESQPDIPKEQLMKLKADILHLLSLAYEIKENDSLHLEYLLKELKVSQETELIHPQIRALHHLGKHYFKNQDYQNACRYFLAVTRALEPKKLKKFMEERMRHSTKDIKTEKEEDLADLQDAEAWVRNFKNNLHNFISPSTSNKLLLEIFREEMELEEMGQNSSSDSSETDETDIYETAEEYNDSIAYEENENTNDSLTNLKE